jgi:hypothetical protein
MAESFNKMVLACLLICLDTEQELMMSSSIIQLIHWPMTNIIFLSDPFVFFI